MSVAGRGVAWTEERSDEGRWRTGAPRGAKQEAVSVAGRGVAWTEERSDEGRWRTGAPRGAKQEAQ